MRIDDNETTSHGRNLAPILERVFGKHRLDHEIIFASGATRNGSAGASGGASTTA